MRIIVTLLRRPNFDVTDTPARHAARPGGTASWLLVVFNDARLRSPEQHDQLGTQKRIGLDEKDSVGHLPVLDISSIVAVAV